MAQMIISADHSGNNGSGIMASASFEELAVHADVQVNFIDFIAAAMCKRIEIDEDRILAAFHMLDFSGTGLLDNDGIRKVLGADASDENVDQIMKELDINNNGQIDYNDFSVYWRKLQVEKRVKTLGKFRQTVKKITTALNVVSAFKSSTVSSVMRLPSLIAPVNSNNSSCIDAPMQTSLSKVRA
jgi:hypothetical protein